MGEFCGHSWPSFFFHGGGGSFENFDGGGPKIFLMGEGYIPEKKFSGLLP